MPDNCLSAIPQSFFSHCGQHKPNPESVEVEVCPFLGFPPVVTFALVNVIAHSRRRDLLRHGVEENGTPADIDVALLEET